MYNICKTKDTFIDPVAAVCPVGARSDSTKRYADICIYAEGIPNARIYLNSQMLKAALLANPQLVKEILELEVENCHCRKNDEKKLQNHLEKLEQDEDGVVNETIEEKPKVKSRSKAKPKTEGEADW